MKVKLQSTRTTSRTENKLQFSRTSWPRHPTRLLPPTARYTSRCVEVGAPAKPNLKSKHWPMKLERKSDPSFNQCTSPVSPAV